MWVMSNVDYRKKWIKINFPIFQNHKTVRNVDYTYKQTVLKSLNVVDYYLKGAMKNQLIEKLCP
jgi:hypothetical protein